MPCRMNRNATVSDREIVQSFRKAAESGTASKAKWMPRSMTHLSNASINTATDSSLLSKEKELPHLKKCGSYLVHQKGNKWERPETSNQ